MKKALFVLLCLVCAGLCRAESAVVYFSATGTTKAVAEKIAGVTGADLYEIIPLRAYTKEDLNYRDENSRCSKEHKDPGARPKIGGKAFDIGAYDVIYLGYPIWWGVAPRIAETFVESYDFAGKIIMPFCTSGSSPIGDSAKLLAERAGSGTWLEGERLDGKISEADLRIRTAAWKKSIEGVKKTSLRSGSMKKKITQTAGRDNLGDFAPLFAHLNDDVLFGEVWNDESVSVKTRCVITVVCLMASGITDSSLMHHLENAKKNGITKDEIAGIITHAAMYCGWPKAWAVFRLAKDVWNEESAPLTDKDRYQNTIFFPIGEPNDAYAKYFVGRSYLAPLSAAQVPVYNVTFEPGCRNNWHVHKASEGGGQMLICVGGRGYYQEWGKDAVEMTPGTVVNIPAGVKHWHGAAADSWFSHLALEIPGKNTSNEWLEPVSDEDYNKLK